MSNIKLDHQKARDELTATATKWMQKNSLYFFREQIKSAFSPNYILDTPDTVKHMNTVRDIVLEAYDNMSQKEKEKMMDNWQKMQLEDDIENEPRYSRADIRTMFGDMNKGLQELKVVFTQTIGDVNGRIFATRMLCSFQEFIENKMHEFLDEGGDTR